MRILLALTALLLTALPAAAQTADTTRVGAVLAEICPGARVRLHGTAGGRVQGRCGPVMDGRLVVTDDGAERALPLAGVREVWVHERQTRRGAILGAGVGAGTLVLTGVLFVNLVCYSSDCTRDYMLAIQYGTLIGGGAGALIGAGIGYLSRDWERRYP